MGIDALQLADPLACFQKLRIGIRCEGGARAQQGIEASAFRNSSLQGGYMILAARALGLDCGPMSGFDAAKMDAAFWAGTAVKTNFICSLGHGNPAKVFGRNPRLAFDEACSLV